MNIDLYLYISINSMHKTIGKLLSLHYVLFENTKPFLLFRTARYMLDT